MDPETRIKRIEKRNARVELDKEWETSIPRRALIAAVTYFIVVWFLHLIEAPRPWLNAVVPAGAYILSTLVLPPARSLWERMR